MTLPILAAFYLLTNSTGQVTGNVAQDYPPSAEWFTVAESVYRKVQVPGVVSTLTATGLVQSAVQPTPQPFENGIESPQIYLNPYSDGHGYRIERDVDGVLIAPESHSDKKTEKQIQDGKKAISDARKADRELIIKLIERRMDATNCNNVVTAANGQFTIYSAEIAQIRGATATSKQGNRWRGVTLIASQTNGATFQVWSAAAVKAAGGETNDWSIVLFK